MALNPKTVLLGGLISLSFPLWVCAVTRDPILAIGENGFPQSDFVDYQISDAPGRSDSPRVINQEEQGQFVVARSSTDVWSVHERAGRFDLSGPVTIPGTGFSVPQTLWSVDGGGAYGHRLQDGRSVGLGLSVGSDSDRLFNSIHETTFRASADYRVPTAPGRAWLFFLNYSNNRHFLNNVPLPGFAYYIDSPVHHVRAVLGFPFLSLLYTPLPQWEGRFSIFGPRRLSTEIGYRIAGPVQTYGRFEWGGQEWLPVNREDHSDRLFFDRKRLMVGLRTPLVHEISLDTSVGREFDRRFFENTSSSYHNVSSAELPSSTFIEAKLAWRFNRISAE